MNEEMEKQLYKIAYALLQMGSGLDAVDKTGNWGYFYKYQKECLVLLDTRPRKYTSKLSSTKPTLHNWFTLRKEVLAMCKNK